MYIKELEAEAFMEVVEAMEYRFNDTREAKEFGCAGVPTCYLNANHRFAKYYVLYENDIPVVTIILQRDGMLVFFIAKKIEKHITLIRMLKAFARETVDKVGPIATKTALWYTEAQRLNVLIGFKDYELYDEYGIYVLE